jgi:hypothetical protein
MHDRDLGGISLLVSLRGTAFPNYTHIEPISGSLCEWHSFRKLTTSSREESNRRKILQLSVSAATFQTFQTGILALVILYCH